MPAKPAVVRSVTEFGAQASDITDNTAALQAAFNAVRPGEWLVFPPGRYLHAASLKLRVPNVTLWSDGATLVATNPADSAIALQADGVAMYGFRLHAVTAARGTQMTQARILIAPAGVGRVRDVVVRRNVIEHAGAPGSALANSASGAGIFVYHAENFLLAENSVKRSLADAIHITNGSINGRVILNSVRENGDDMIAVVSYMAARGTAIDAMTSQMSALREARLNRNILITRNDLGGQYWGRGITVVGGENVTIENNMVANTTHGAGILLARDVGYLSFGVHNVVVRNNTVQHVQTTAAAYSTGGAAAPTGHAGIEIHSLASAVEVANGDFSSAIAVDRVRVENNTVDDTRADGVRVGVGGGKVGLIALVNNKLSNIGNLPLNVAASPSNDYNVFCSGNTNDGNAASSNLCMGSTPVATGAALTCRT